MALIDIVFEQEVAQEEARNTLSVVIDIETTEANIFIEASGVTIYEFGVAY